MTFPPRFTITNRITTDLTMNPWELRRATTENCDKL